MKCAHISKNRIWNNNLIFAAPPSPPPPHSYISSTELYGCQPTTSSRSSPVRFGVRTGTSGKFCPSRSFRGQAAASPYRNMDGFSAPFARTLHTLARMNSDRVNKIPAGGKTCWKRKICFSPEKCLTAQARTRKLGKLGNSGDLVQFQSIQVISLERMERME